MKNYRKSNPLALVAILACVLVQSTTQGGQRSISDFVSRQGMWSLHLNPDGTTDCAASAYDGGLSGFLFSPPLPNIVTWTSPQDSSSAYFDYAGVISGAIPGGLGTSIDGSINEVVHQDGTVTDTILIHATHALAWATTGFAANGTDLFGHQGVEVLAGAEPSFGSCTFRLVLNGPAANQPLPDFVELLYGCSSWQIATVDFAGAASGTLPDGTPAQLQIAETGLLTVSGTADGHSRVAFDGFPVEHILIRSTAGH